MVSSFERLNETMASKRKYYKLRILEILSGWFPDDEDEISRQLGIARPALDGRTLQECLDEGKGNLAVQLLEACESGAYL